MRQRTILAAIIIVMLNIFMEGCKNRQDDPEVVFINPPEEAKPGVLWMWMGSNITKEGITKDLETLKKAGFSRTTMFSLADVTTDIPAEISNRPGPEIISWTEPWWKMVRFAAEESKRLGMDFGMFNCPGYETSGGVWITPELSMQDLCWSQQNATGGKKVVLILEKPKVDPKANHPFNQYNRETGKEEVPVIKARKTYYKDAAVVAVPLRGDITVADVIDLTGKMQPDGTLMWDAPAGDWTVYRFGHTTKGSLIFPAQWQATGLECDKMSREAVEFHMDHIIGEIKKHLGDLVGTGFTHVHFDSYEAGIPGWTPKMPEEFNSRRGYDIRLWLPIFAGRKVGTTKDSLKFRNDFLQTMKDLYRDVYFTTISKKLADAGLTFLSEPYGGPWDNNEIMPLVHKVMVEFWTDKGVFTPFELEPTIAALRKAGKNIIDAEGLTGQPWYSKWSEYPAWLKPIADASYCAGVNRLVIHRYTHQPFADKYRPGLTMGHWGTHFDRTQTWWEPARAMFVYWQKCQALLQWGRIDKTENDFAVSDTTGVIKLGHIHRKMGNTDIFFVANTSHNMGNASCSFRITGMQPELWDPVKGTMRKLYFYRDSGARTSIPLKFDDAQSFFIVFREKEKSRGAEGSNFPDTKQVADIKGPWKVSFDPKWGGPGEPVLFDNLQDWTLRPEKGIKYYSGTATYRTEFDVPLNTGKRESLLIDLGMVKHIAKVRLNGKDLGVIWTAPWNVEVSWKLLKEKGNILEIEVTNEWANRLIGDENEPPETEWNPSATYFNAAGSWMKRFPDWFVKDRPRPSTGRYCFTTWNYFTKDSALISSGLLGPVTLKYVDQKQD